MKGMKRDSKGIWTSDPWISIQKAKQKKQLILPSRPEVWTIKLCGSVIAAVFTDVEIFLYQGSYGTVNTIRLSQINKKARLTAYAYSN